MGYFNDEEEIILSDEQKKLQGMLLGKSGGRYVDNKLIVFASENIDPTDNSGKAALKCGDCVFCIRDHMGYQHYRKSDRSECPSSCPLNKEY